MKTHLDKETKEINRKSKRSKDEGMVILMESTSDNLPWSTSFLLPWTTTSPGVHRSYSLKLQPPLEYIFPTPLNYNLPWSTSFLLERKCHVTFVLSENRMAVMGEFSFVDKIILITGGCKEEFATLALQSVQLFRAIEMS